MVNISNNLQHIKHNIQSTYIRTYISVYNIHLYNIHGILFTLNYRTGAIASIAIPFNP